MNDVRFILVGNSIVNCDAITCIYIKKTGIRKDGACQGAAIMMQFAQYPEDADEIEYKRYNSYSDAIVALSKLADRLGATELHV